MALATTKILQFRMHPSTPRGIEPAPYCAHSRDASPTLLRYVFFSSPTPTSKRWDIAPCHYSAPVFALSLAFIAAFSVFAITSSPTFMSSSETWRELQKILALIRGRVTVLRGRRSSTLRVDNRSVDFRTSLRVKGTSPHRSTK